MVRSGGERLTWWDGPKVARALVSRRTKSSGRVPAMDRYRWDWVMKVRNSLLKRLSSSLVRRERWSRRVRARGTRGAAYPCCMRDSHDSPRRAAWPPRDRRVGSAATSKAASASILTPIHVRAPRLARSVVRNLSRRTLPWLNRSPGRGRVARICLAHSRTLPPLEDVTGLAASRSSPSGRPPLVSVSCDRER